MGAGNPLIRSYDPELYSAQTYYIDFTECYDLDEFCKKELEKNQDEYRTLEDLSDDDKYNMLYSQLELDLYDFRSYYFTSEDLFGNLYTTPDKDDRFISELSAAFRGEAIVIAESDDAYILTTSDSEYQHFSIGIVPKFQFEILAEDVDYEQQHKFDWYCARDNEQGYYDMCIKLTNKLYNKKLKLFLKTHEPTMRTLHKHYGKQMSSRNGALTSTSLKIIGNDFNFL